MELRNDTLAVYLCQPLSSSFSSSVTEVADIDFLYMTARAFKVILSSLSSVQETKPLAVVI